MNNIKYKIPNYSEDRSIDVGIKNLNSTLIMDCYIIKENYIDIPDLLRYCRKNEIAPYFETFVEIGQSKKIIKELILSEKN